MPLWLVVILVLALDQGTKLLVKTTMGINQSIPVIKNVFHLTFVLNAGAAFSMLERQTIFFIVTTVLVLGAILYYLRQVPKEKFWLRLGLALLLGGATGNLIDRIRMGLVVDFFDFRVFPVFNIADIAISVGVGLLILDLLFSKEDKPEIEQREV